MWNRPFMVMRFHLTSEDDLRTQCPYCGCTLKPGSWESVFYIDRHYKSITCKCGKKHMVRVDFIGCGHDIEWSKDVPLDRKAKDVSFPSKFDELVEAEHNKIR